MLYQTINPYTEELVQNISAAYGRAARVDHR